MKIGKKITATVLSLLMVLSHIVWFPMGSTAATQATNEGYVSLDGTHLNYKNMLTARDDGTYELLIEANSTYAMEETNTHSEFSENGYYVVKKAGKYLVELWGGNGATISPDGTALGKGGIGGAGGHVYGVIDLKVGDVLFYSLGGNGSKTKENGVGGGANGVGGTHGGAGSTTVGGGGGYSALYLFSGSDFTVRYLNAEGELVRDTILESDRLSKYIMIAGGGGGAGAYSSDKTALPNGGAGGSIGHTTGVLSGSAYDVQGTFFVGKDGASSGSNLGYVGKGGSNQPGKAIGTMLGWTDTESPNDWRGTYNNSLSGGAGGAGNLRGGAGGAGFCGGSGGVMESFISPNNVGGGGGGSSFIASLMTYQLTEAQAAFLTNVNPSKTGGAVCITYVEESGVDYLNDLTIRFNTSKYFSVVSAEAINVTQGITYENTKSAEELENAEFEFHGVRAGIDETLKIRIVLAPMLHFAGGNHVPIFGAGKLWIETPDENAHGNGEILLGEACGYVNVPLHFTLHPQNHTTNDPGHSHHVKDLYSDNYAEARENLHDPDYADAYLYDFIDSIGEYQVTDMSGTTPLPSDGAVQPTETTKYLLQLTVIPKSTEQTGVAQVGDIVTERTFVDIITVTVVGSNVTELNGNWLSYSKNISYDENSGGYKISLGVKSDTDRALTMIPQLPDFTYAPSGDSSAPTQVQTTVILHSGYYYIEIWGGNGGHGGASSWFGSEGGAGGAGVRMAGWFYLQKGDVLHVHIGANGADGDNGSGFLAGGKGGKGGEPSAVALMDPNDHHKVLRYLMIAGGGAGGSGGWAGQNKDGQSPSVTDKSIPADVDTIEEVLAKYKGKDGTDGASGALGSSAEAGHNAYDPAYYNVEDEKKPLTNALPEAGTHQNNGGGAFHLTYIQLDNVTPDDKRAPELTDYHVEFALAKYFELQKYEVIDNQADGAIIGSSLVENENTYTVLHVSGIDPTVKTKVNGDVEYKTVDFTVNFYVKAREEFLGGNDVMLVDVSPETKAATGLTTGIKIVQSFVNANDQEIVDSVDIMENSATDYVNVPIKWEQISEGIVEARNKVHLIGESDSVKLDQLYMVDTSLRDAIIADFNSRPAWASEYVVLAASITDGNGVSIARDALLAPNETTDYHLFFGIVPKTPSYYARVADPVEAFVLGEDTVTIYAAYRVTFDLPEYIYMNQKLKENIKDIKYYDPDYSGEQTVYVVEQGKDCSVFFAIQAGDYSLPETVTVKLGGENGVLMTPDRDYVYTRETESLTVYAASITGPIHIVVEETEEQYTLHYVVQQLDATGKPSDGFIDFQVPNLWAGDPIDVSAHYTAALAAAGIQNTNLLGYSFAWDWGDGNATPLNYMPAADWWIFGAFAPNTYTVKVLYLDEQGRELGEAYVADYQFGESFAVTSPTFMGYATDTVAYSATVDGTLIAQADENGVITIEVRYATLSNEAVINLIREDGSIADVCKILFHFGTRSYTLTSDLGLTYIVTANFNGESVAYRVTLPKVVGHHTAESVLEGNLSVGDGNTHEIHYLANRYVLDFNSAGGECAETARTVVYGMPYTFDGVSYTTFPTAVKIGSNFLYWQDGSGVKLDENEIVTLDAENGATISLTAVWETNMFTVIVSYAYEDGTSVNGLPPVVAQLPYGTSYRYEAPSLDGFTPTPTQYTGVMPAQNLALVFTYYEDEVMNVVEVTITWGSLSFEATHGIWNPEKLRYETDIFEPEGDNTVSVENTSATVDVNVNLSYAAAFGYESINGYFTEESSAAARKNSAMSVPTGSTGVRYVWLDGEIPQSAPENTSIPCGTVTLTVTPQS